MDSDAPVWVLLGGRTGDNNQLLRVADELGLPFRSIQLRYNPLHLIPPRFAGASLASLTGQSRRKIHSPWPKLVLGIGYRSVSTALAIRKASGGKTKLVRLGNARMDPRTFDLVITTPQYDVPDAPNMIRLPVGIPTAPPLQPTEDETQWLALAPRPHRLLLIGGDTFMWTLEPRSIGQAATEVAARGGSVIAVSSPRSNRPVTAAVAAAGAAIASGFARYPVLLADADEIYVTGDSVSMVSDAIATGKPVGIIRPVKTPLGRLLYSLSRLTARSVPVRDIGRFVDAVLERRLAGSVEKPIAGRPDIDPLATAVAAIGKLL